MKAPHEMVASFAPAHGAAGRYIILNFPPEREAVSSFDFEAALLTPKTATATATSD
jgi:hypothetical protein